ncbi:lipoprotein [Aquamicrobium sp. NLF2-7]|jgi:hypothetical protein|uniref:Type IV secretion system putative lipoprotein virB7 n=1 Tax=Aquamicrobium lusatiense TaxID=89772 RepID=A0A7W9VU85_9HYPH|nr:MULTISPECIES: lipoprotein [Aquamicrobium]MBB6010727.1 uncharacterized protein YcfJ [Aquamicrobium lusatiense]MCG8271520.1 lipoprotein [Aquamicrobium sp. NLF2-7]MCK9550122.1 lipoprotein [Aquamicrobium sp.]MDH4991252.1 lipoprotein [Aquamicrobium lusatiense]
MRKIIVALAAIVALSGCTTTEQDVGVGAVAGAAIGGIAGGTKGALIGTAVGAGSGLLVRNLRNGYCQYRDPNTRRIYTARCN